MSFKRRYPMGSDKTLANSGDAEREDVAEEAAPGRGGVTRRSLLARAGATGVMLGIPNAFAAASTRTAHEGEMSPNPLQRDFLNPPQSAQAGVYWWWLDGAASMEGITADLESMSQQGICYALLFSAGGGGANAPKGPPFMSDEWRKYFRHAVQEAARLGIEIGVNICDGWNCGGPWVAKE